MKFLDDFLVAPAVPQPAGYPLPSTCASRCFFSMLEGRTLTTIVHAFKQTSFVLCRELHAE